MKNKTLININEINEPLKCVSISDTDYVTPSGKVYKKISDDLYYPKKNSENNANHYMYTSIHCSDGKQRGVRTHRLVAEAFLPNPDNLPVVMHLDNDKSNNDISNLKWGTVAENTKCAFDDGLEKNDKGLEDSQSLQIGVYDIDKNYLDWYGSVSIASKALNVSKSTILRQCYGEIKGKPRCGYYFRFLEECLQDDFVL